MNILRRALATVAVLAVFATVVAIDRQDNEATIGATSALIPLAGFPQKSSGTRISTSWFCPGAAAGDGLEGANVVIANPSDAELVAAVRLLTDSESTTEDVVVEPRSQARIEILRGRTTGVVAPVVEIVGSVGSVEQELTYAAGNVTSQCVSQTAGQWYFADGFTAEGSRHRLALINPYPESAVVDISYVTVDGARSPTALQGMIVPARSVRNLSLADHGASNETRIAVEVRATTGQIVASRMQHYLGAGRLGYSTTVGVPEALEEWWFSSGRTGSTVTEQLVFFNPTGDDARINIAFFGEGITNDIPIDDVDAPAPPSTQVVVPAGDVVVINTANVVDLPAGDHAMSVSTLDGTRIVVEHVLSQQTANSSFTAITNAIPAGLTSRVWRVPTGLAQGARNALSVMNAAAVDGTYTVYGIGPGGQVALPGLVDVPLPAASLVFMDVPEGATDGEVVIEANVEIVVQRRTRRGPGLVGFGIVSALPVRTR